MSRQRSLIVAEEMVNHWLALLPKTVSTEAVSIAVFDLVSRYENQARKYHTLAHLAHIKAELAPVEHLLQDPAGVQLAIDGHDVIQEPKVGNDEENSLKWMQTTLQILGVPVSAFPSLEPCVLGTKHVHTAPPTESDARYFVDADISVFGGSVSEYQAFANGVRYEYRWVPESMYRRERAKVLQGFLGRKRVFLTEFFQDAYETKARENLTREITLLSK